MRLRRLAAATTAAAVSALWFTLYSYLPMYPPALGLPLAIVAILFLIVLALLHRMHGDKWPGLAQFGFIVSAIGLGLWLVGGTLNALGMQISELIAQPQPGWGLFSAGLMPIGFAAIRSRLSLPVQLLLPLGALFVLGQPLKYFLGDQTGGLAVFLGFGVGSLAIGALLLFDTERASAGRLSASRDASSATLHR